MKKITLLGVFVALIGWQTRAQITTYPYTEDFESGAGGWAAMGIGSWALGLPISGVINSAASGSNSWVTALAGSYSNNETGWVESPEFDFTSVASPAIQFSLWLDTEQGYDGFVLQSSIDGGTSWQNVGGVEPNWYNNTNIWGNPGGQSIGWDGSTNGWISAAHDLNGLGGMSSVYLRMAFGSDGSVTYDGVGFDDIYIFNVTCPAPTALSATYLAPDSVIVSWVNGATETSWNVEYGPIGYAQGTGTSSVFNSNPDTIVGVAPNQLYDIYIQADCGAGDESIWYGPYVLSTLQNDDACNAVLVPVDGSTTTYSNIGATTQVGEPGSVENTVWFKVIVPASGHLAIGTCGEDFDTELNVYSVTDCSDFLTYTDEGYADWNPWNCSGAHPAGIELCGMTPDDTLYFWVDGYFGSAGNFPLTVWELDVEAGTGISTDACVDDSLNLWTQLSGQSTNSGFWTYPSNPMGIANDSLFVTSNATVGGDELQYITANACMSDTAFLYVTVFEQSYAGEDGSLTVCIEAPFNLFSGLTGLVDLGGQWYDPNNSAVPSDLIAGSIPGQFNYDYVVGNGVCPDDTSNMILNITDIGCGIGLNESSIENFSLYPNPTNSVLNISNTASNEVFSYELMDINGKVVSSEASSIQGGEITTIDLNNFETGFYLIRIFNDNAEMTYRVVKQ